MMALAVALLLLLAGWVLPKGRVLARLVLMVYLLGQYGVTGAPGWAVAALGAGAVFGYATLHRGLRRLAQRQEITGAGILGADMAENPPDPVAPFVNGPLSDQELDRYARHIVLREIGGPGQRRLRAARVAVVGAGGLGAPVLLYLAAAGVGRITICDDDEVSLSNLQRQVIYRTQDIGQPKTHAARAAMLALNPHIEVITAPRLTAENAAAILAGHDLVIDGSDLFTTRQMVNAACVAAGVPLLSGAIAQWEGQVTIYDPARGAPCLACVFPKAPDPAQAGDCANGGVVGALAGVIGTIMALEAVKTLTSAGQDLRGRMLLYDGLGGQTRLFRLHRQDGCPICSQTE